MLENRALGRGRVVSLKVVVVPATRAPAAPDPVVFITGGPGQAATEDVADVLASSARAAAARDFVFIDQRGMGWDSPLRCRLIDGPDLGNLAAGALPESRIRACLASMDADPAQYTSSAAADDLDQVLSELGYAQVNLMGASYGTFVSQTFAHAHPSRVRSMVLDGVALPSSDFILRFAASAQMGLEQTFAECEANAECHARHPSLPLEMEAALSRLRAHPETVTAEGPDGKKYSATLDAAAFAMAIRGALYGARSRGDVPAMIHDVAEGRFDTTAERTIFTAIAISEILSVGGYLSIACTEALAGVTLADAERASAKTFLGTARIAPILHACTFWPKGAAPSWLHEPLVGDVPVLLLGGTMDPATPLANIEKVASSLRNAQAVVVPGEAHGILGNPCIDGIVATFLDAPLVKVSSACVKPVHTQFDAPKK